MSNNFLGEIRRTQVLDYGPGAIIDFRAGVNGGGSVSVVATGLEHWDQCAKPPFPGNYQVISEPRLERQLGVSGFRLPPVDNRDRQNDPIKSYLIGARFPNWLQCPSCNELQTANRWDKEPGDPSRWCPKCSIQGRRVHVIPVRFVTACKNGHLDEFPWDWWLSNRAIHKLTCESNKPMKLENRGSIGLSGLFLICGSCNSSTPMSGIFGENTLTHLNCKGRRPWLGNHNEDCDATPRVLQRRASNLYFPVIVSALSIPPWSDKLQQLIGIRWSEIKNATRDDRKVLLRVFESQFKTVLNMSLDKVLDEIDKRVHDIEKPQYEDLKLDEYKNLTESAIGVTNVNYNDEFEVRQQHVPCQLKPYIDQLAKVVRLREVRALKSFTRIYEPESAFSSGKAKLCELSNTTLPWLPAVEVRGEGVFISLNIDSLRVWEKMSKVVERANLINQQYQQSLKKSDSSDDTSEFVITARHLLVHSLAHVLLRHVSLECGYETASIRERLYVENEPDDVAGLLIYTSSSDSEGTLGGLARQAEPELFEEIIRGALDSIGWCSSDPLCIKGITSVSETFNWAACHSCILVPETSCEHFNRFLDRTMLIGNRVDRIPGYFEKLLVETLL